MSKYKSSTAKTMVGKPRDYSLKHQNPGPGSYMAFSEFGIYESKNAHNGEDRNNKSRESM